MQRLTAYAYIALSVLTFAQTAEAGNSLLRIVEARSKSLGQVANQTQADLQAKLDQDAALAKKKAAELANQAVEQVKQSQNNLEQDLINGKAAVQQSLACEFRRIEDHASVSGEVVMDLTKESRALVPVGELFPEDPKMARIAIGFSGKISKPDEVSFELVNLDDGKAVRRAASLHDLGLSLDAECIPKRQIVYLHGNNAAIDTTDRISKVGRQTGEALKSDAQSLLDSITAE